MKASDPPNRLRGVREQEGVTRAELARLAGISVRTVQRAEEGQAISLVTKSRILKALNRVQDRAMDYALDYIFGSAGMAGRARDDDVGRTRER